MKDIENKGTIVPSTPVQSDGVKSFKHSAQRARICQLLAGKIACNICAIEKFRYLCDTLHFERRTNARRLAGVLRPKYDCFTASYPRVVRLMATLPLERCKVTGKVRPFFYYLTLIA